MIQFPKDHGKVGSAYPERTYKHGDIRYAALEADFWTKHFDTSKKVVVYWPNEADDPTLIAYYETVSAGKTGRLANAKANGALPTISVNPLHPDLVKLDDHFEPSRDAREDLPDWYDEDL